LDDQGVWAFEREVSKLAKAIVWSSNEKRGLTRWEDARNTNGARSATLLTPTPPQRTGRDACVHEASVKRMLRRSDMARRCDLKDRRCRGRMSPSLEMNEGGATT